MSAIFVQIVEILGFLHVLDNVYDFIPRDYRLVCGLRVSVLIISRYFFGNRELVNLQLKKRGSCTKRVCVLKRHFHSSTLSL